MFVTIPSLSESILSHYGLGKVNSCFRFNLKQIGDEMIEKIILAGIWFDLEVNAAARNSMQHQLVTGPPHHTSGALITSSCVGVQ